MGEAEVPDAPHGTANRGGRDRVHLCQDGEAEPLQLVSFSVLSLSLSLVSLYRYILRVCVSFVCLCVGASDALLLHAPSWSPFSARPSCLLSCTCSCSPPLSCGLVKTKKKVVS